MGKFLPPTWATAAAALLLAAGTGYADQPGPSPAAKTAAEVDRLLKEEVLGDAPLARRVDDETFLRRAALDLVGDLPAPESIAAFVLDPSEKKRAQVVERLLANPQYGQNWARYWRDVILSRRVEDRALLVANPLVVHLTEQFNSGTPWNEIAAGFITAEGDIRENGATAIIAAQDGETEGVTAEVSRIFLGIQIQCAQCHDHVTDRWKRRQFHEWAAFFPRVALRPLLTPTQRTLQVVAIDRRQLFRRRLQRGGALEHRMADLDRPQEPGEVMQPIFFLTGQQLQTGTPDAQRRETAAQWMTENQWFSKSLVNRLWSELVGEGFYEPVDDLGPDRQASAPRTLDYLSQQFVGSGYDLKWLFRVIMATEAYQRESRERRSFGETPFTANCQQRLRADQLFNALTSALEIVEPTPGVGGGRGGAYGIRPTRRTIFSLAFGFDPSLPRDEISGSIPQALALMNSPQISSQIDASSERTMLGRLLTTFDEDELAVEELYLKVLARTPDEQEVTKCLRYIRSTGRKAGYEDLLWALLNSAEFLYRR